MLACLFVAMRDEWREKSSFRNHKNIEMTMEKYEKSLSCMATGLDISNKKEKVSSPSFNQDVQSI